MARLYSHLQNPKRFIVLSIDEILALFIPVVMAATFLDAIYVAIVGIPFGAIIFIVLLRLKKDGGLFRLKRMILWHASGALGITKHSPPSYIRVMKG